MGRHHPFVPAITLLTALAVLGSSRAQCQSSFTAFQDSCYFVFTGFKLNWARAARTCRQLDSYVAIIDNVKELNFLKSLLRNSGSTSPCPWLGGFYVQARAVDGRNLTFFDYSDGTMCTCLYASMDYSIVKGECKTPDHFVCEQSMTPTQVTRTPVLPAPSKPLALGRAERDGSVGGGGVGGLMYRAADLVRALVLGASGDTQKLVGLQPRDQENLRSSLGFLLVDGLDYTRRPRTAALEARNFKSLMTSLAQEPAYSPGLFRGLTALMARYGYSCSPRRRGLVESLTSLLFGTGSSSRSGSRSGGSTLAIPPGYDLAVFWRRLRSLQQDRSRLQGLLDTVFDFLADNNIACVLR